IFETIFAGGDEASVGEHEVCGNKVIDRESAFSSQVTHAAAQSQAAHTGRRNDSGWDRHAKSMCGMIDIGPGTTSSNPYGDPLRMHVCITNRRQIHDNTSVATAKSSRVVSSAADRQPDLVFAGEIHRSDDVRYIGASHDPTRPPIDHCVIDLTGFFIRCVAWS